MKFPSLQSLASALVKVVRRFPLEMMFALMGTISAITFIELGDLEVKAENTCARLIMIADLGLVLTLSATLYSERKIFTRYKKLLLGVLAALTSGALFFLLDPLNRETDILRFLLLALAFHLLVSFIAFLGGNKIEEFWQYNKTLFLRFLTGVLFSAVLFLGLAAAIGSMNFLFNFKFEWDTFAILWVCIAGLFQTIFFLSGVPELDTLNRDHPYPNALKIFTQYVLIPLASVYALILLAYEVKILIQWELPKGLVSNLILGYAVFGILSLLLVYPVKDLDENKWIKTYSRNFYYLLIPLIGLLIWAVLARVIDYGITEERYFLIILSGWLTFIAAYFLISKRQDISIIPLSLCIVTLLSVYGPQGAFQSAERSQVSELRGLFEKSKAVKQDKLLPLKADQGKNDQLRMSNIVDYLINMHGLQSFQPLLERDLKIVGDSLLTLKNGNSYNSGLNKWELRSRQKEWIYKYLNITEKSSYSSTTYNKTYTFEADDIDLVTLDGADYLINLNISSDTLNTVIKGDKFSVYKNLNTFNIRYKDEFKSINMDSVIRNLNAKLKLSPNVSVVNGSKIKQSTEFKGLSVGLLWDRMTFDDQNTLIYGSGSILITLK